MGYDYDALYGETLNALGEPSKAFVTFFNKLDRRKLRVLDIGCGQGRDAIFIARLGHHVTGIDISANGIHDLNDAANSENLDIIGITIDLMSFQPDSLFDILLIDRTLHMLPKPARSPALARLLDYLKPNGWALIADETKNFDAFEQAMSAHARNWNVTKRARGYYFAQLLDS